MTTLPATYHWTGTDFMPAKAPEASIVVADSWRVTDTQVWGLTEHLQRFFRGIRAQHVPHEALEGLEPHRLENALKACFAQYPGIALFPRLTVEYQADQYRVVLLIRPAPTPRKATSLRIPQYTDPRTRPTVKGPDIGLMRRLVFEAPTDDVVLHDGTNVIETTTGGLIIWHSPTELVLCQADQQLASISVKRIAHYATSQSLHVTRRPVTIQDIATGEYPIWFANTLHGISPVNTIIHGAEEQTVRAHPAAAQWQAAWWARLKPEASKR